jgi:hypothetical protein
MNKQLNMSVKVLAFAAVLWFVAGCASANSPTPSTSSLVGTWATTITEEEAPTFKGQYEVTFADNGRVSFVVRTGTGIPLDMGTYTITQDHLFLTDERSVCLKVGFPKAIYTWSVEDDTLTLTAIDDVCYNRRKSAERTWMRKTTVGMPAPTIKPMLK